MSRSRMTMRAVVERNGASGTDPHGGPLAPAFAAHATLACFVWSTRRAQVVDGAKTAMVEDHRAMFPLGADIIEDDEIASVTNRLGVEVLSGRFQVKALRHKHRHIEATLLRVQ